jgi:hypothetical protein
MPSILLKKYTLFSKTKKGKIANGGDGKSFSHQKSAKKMKTWDDGLSSDDGSLLSSVDSDDDEDMGLGVKAHDKISGPDGFSSDSSDSSLDGMARGIDDHEANDSSNSSTLDGAEGQTMLSSITREEILQLGSEMQRIQNLITSLHSKFSSNMDMLQGFERDGKFDPELLNFGGKGRSEKENDIFL